MTFFAALSNEAAGWPTRFVHPLFAYYKIGAFLLLQANLAILIAVVLTGLLSNTDKKPADNSPQS